MNRPEVAIVILNYNGRHFLEQFLPSVLKTDYPNFRVIVADNASTDDSLSYLKEHFNTDIEILEMSVNHGFAEGYNQALKAVDSPYFVLLNSDVEVSTTWLDQMIQKIETDESIAAIQPKIRSFHEKDFFEYAGASGGWIDFLGYPFCRGRVFNKAELDHCQYDDAQEIFWSTGAAMLIKRELFLNIGGFDGSFFAHMEEIDLCWRLKRAGYKIFVEPSAVVYHVGGGTMDYNSPNKAYLNFRNNLILLFKNEPFLKKLWLIPLRLILDGIAGGLFLSEGKFAHIWAIFRAHFAFYGRIPKIMKRKRIEKQAIDKIKISDTPNMSCVLKKSIVWGFYIKKRSTFKELMKES